MLTKYLNIKNIDRLGFYEYDREDNIIFLKVSGVFFQRGLNNILDSYNVKKLNFSGIYMDLKTNIFTQAKAIFYRMDQEDDFDFEDINVEIQI